MMQLRCIPSRAFRSTQRFQVNQFRHRSLKQSPHIYTSITKRFWTSEQKFPERNFTAPPVEGESPSIQLQNFLQHASRNKVTKNEVINELNVLLHVVNKREAEIGGLQKEVDDLEKLHARHTAKQAVLGIVKVIAYGVALYVVYQLMVKQSVPGGDIFKDNFQEYHPPSKKGSATGQMTTPADNEDGNPLSTILWQKKQTTPNIKFDVITFDDVMGNDDAKEELADLVDYLRNPGKYEKMGLKIPKGILLAGPPGTGKTLLARALAGEAEVPFINVNGSSFVQMFAGVGAQRVRRLFQRARELSPVIVFIDEIDALGSRRDLPQNHSTQTLNQMLGEMDGFTESTGVIVIGATNLAHTLDPALTRPGRFDRTVQISVPDKKVRKEIISHYLEGKGDKSVDVDLLASGTIGLTGADLFQLVNRAGIEAVKRGKDKIDNEMLLEAQETLLMGRASKDSRMSEKTRQMVAFHEAGHALVSLYTPGADPIYKATMLPRGGALGFVAHTPKEEHLKSKEAMIAHMDVCMGGRAAEELIFGKDQVTQGASSDFQQATRTALNMVARYGMSDKVGKVYHSEKDMEKLSPDELGRINCEVKDILDGSYTRAVNMLKTRAKQHKLLADALLKDETLSVAQIKEKIGFIEPIEPAVTSNS